METLKEVRECISTESFKAIQESQEWIIKSLAFAKLIVEDNFLFLSYIKAAKEHLENIADILKRETEEKGQIPFLSYSDFVSLALPLERVLNNSDYYSTKSEKLDLVHFLQMEMVRVKKDFFY